MTETHAAGGAGLDEWLDWFRSQAHVLSRNPALLFQQAFNSPDGSALAAAAARRALQGSVPPIWFRWVNKRSASACLATLAGHAQAIVDCCFSPDGRKVLSASRDRTLRLWNAATGAEIASLKGLEDLKDYDNLINAIGFSPDGRRIACASKDNVLRIWDGESGAQAATLRGHRAGKEVASTWQDLGVYGFAFSPDSRTVVTASEDHTLKVWDVESGTDLKTLRGHRRAVLACAFAPDGRRLVSGSSDRGLRAWDPDTGAEIAVIGSHESNVSWCAFASDGRRLLSYGDDVALWDAADFRKIASVRGDSRKIVGCSFSASGNRFVTFAGDYTIGIWSAETGERVNTISLGSMSFLRGAILSPDGTRVATQQDKAVNVFDAQTGEHLSTFQEHGDRVTALAYSRDGSRLVSGSWDSDLRLWAANQATEGPGLKREIVDLASSPATTIVASASRQGIASLWDRNDGREILSIRAAPELSGLASVAMSPDGSRVATSASFRGVAVWDARTGERTAETPETEWAATMFTPRGDFLIGTTVRIMGHGHSTIVKAEDLSHVAVPHSPDRWIRSVATSPDGTRVMAALLDKHARGWDADQLIVWELARPDRVIVLADDAAEVRACAFAPDGRRVASGSSRGVLTVWDATPEAASRDKRELLRIQAHGALIESCAFSPDGRWLVSGSDDRSVKVWDTERGACRATLAGHTENVALCAFAGSDRRVISGSQDGTLRLWDVDRGTELARLRDAQWSDGRSVGWFRGTVPGCVWGPGAGELLALFDDRTLRLWNVERGEIMQEFASHTAITCLDWTSSSTVAAGTADGGVMFLSLERR